MLETIRAGFESPTNHWEFYSGALQISEISVSISPMHSSIFCKHQAEYLKEMELCAFSAELQHVPISVYRSQIFTLGTPGSIICAFLLLW